MLSPKMKLLLSIILITVVLTLVFDLAGLLFPIGGYSLYIVVFVIAVLFYVVVENSRQTQKQAPLTTSSVIRCQEHWYARDRTLLHQKNALIDLGKGRK